MFAVLADVALMPLRGRSQAQAHRARTQAREAGLAGVVGVVDLLAWCAWLLVAVVVVVAVVVGGCSDGDSC